MISPTREAQVVEASAYHAIGEIRARQTHKALTAPGSLVLILAPAVRQAQELFTKVAGFYHTLVAAAMACRCGERYLTKFDSLPRPGIIATEGVPVAHSRNNSSAARMVSNGRGTGPRGKLPITWRTMFGGQEASMEYPVEHRAERLLREMGRQAEGKFEPIVDPTEAAERLNIDTASLVYEEALNRLLERGHLEETHHPALGTTVGAYRLTEEGLARAKELRSR